MNLFKRGNVYWVEWVKNGVRHRKSTGTKLLKEARRFLDGIRIATRAPGVELAIEFIREYYGEDRRRGTPIGEAWAQYERLAHATGRDKVEKKTMDGRRRRIANLLAWLEESMPRVNYIEDVDGPVAASYAEYLKLVKDPKPLKDKTRQNIISDLGTVWRMLEKVAPGIRNPWESLSPKVTDGQRLDDFTPEQARDVLAAARRIGKGWPLAVLLEINTALRYVDIANMRWSEVDLDGWVIRLPPHKTKAYGITVAIPIVLDDLRDELKAAHEEAMKAEEGTAAREYVLPRHAILYGNCSKWAYRELNFAEVLIEAGISGNYTIHSFRHFMRTRMSATQAPQEVAMRMLGHRDERTSARYDHDEHLQEMRDALKRALSDFISPASDKEPEGRSGTAECRVQT